jgi:Protein of unknown function (DUF3892)
MATYRIVCSKLDPSHNNDIKSVNDQNGATFTVDDVLTYIKGGNEFLVVRPGFPVVKIHPTRDGRYITTNPDGTKCNNLHNLPRCP